eukprot:CAMPEP_0197028032 /NCGR_PEP_ID=MMETSP1384-20130603/7840_1 /TAXON_ID=29189 /ORGANISM="Ammonia sp." /LENGTH=380 /DNA_ID=CAMNT_0042456969 /DNA_START=60 /DNA_END=1202 /DNA_ORIENTATION=-
MPGTCAYCSCSNASMRCGGCKRRYYCNAECQRTHWKRHKTECKKLRNGKLSLPHQEDIEQLRSILDSVQNSELLVHSKVPPPISQYIAEFACGEVIQCANEQCEAEIFLFLSERSDPSRYQKADLAFDYDAKHIFGCDPFLCVYCQRCKDIGHRCRRCDSFHFEAADVGQSCCRCRTEICAFCSARCQNPRCKVKYCVYGDASSFTSGCGETFLCDLDCEDCGEEYTVCHGCDDKFESQCPDCKTAAKERRKPSEKTESKKYVNLMRDVKEKKKACAECEGEANEEDGRVCAECNIFVCGEHCNEYGKFCRGVCDKFCCNDCVMAAALKPCRRDQCEEYLCTNCEFKCENCWDFLALHGVDDDDIEQALKNGNYSDYSDF